jgi:Flp pilus assembly protein CpaB
MWSHVTKQFGSGPESPFGIRRRWRRVRPTMRRWIRRCWHSRLLTALLVIGALLGLRGIYQREQYQAKQWGTQRSVVTATRSLRAGTVLAASDVRSRRLPIIAIPHAAINENDILVGRTLRQHVEARSILTDSDVGVANQRPLRIAIGPNRVALAFASSAGQPELVVGDIVDVVLTAQPSSDTNQPRNSSVQGLEVVAVTEQAITVAANPAEVTQLALPLAQGNFTVVLHGA